MLMPDAPLVIGLVNNMPDAALEATERQFHGLISAAAAAGGRRFELRLIALPGVPRSAAARSHVERRYFPASVVAEGGVDGLIITGTEPRAARLPDEPYWGELVGLFEAARRNTASTIMSCLAAHAAVLHFDGIERRRFPDKLHGIFECNAVGDHPLAAGLGGGRRVPHSRFNDLPEEALTAHGYRVLARADGVGADFFVKDGPSVIVFLQGHPEYDRFALMREYRRDVGRYLNREREAYPRQPHEYFEAPMAAALRDFERRAIAERDPALMSSLPPLEGGCPPDARWRGHSVRLYENWLALLAERRKPRTAPALSGALYEPLRQA